MEAFNAGALITPGAYWRFCVLVAVHWHHACDLAVCSELFLSNLIVYGLTTIFGLDVSIMDNFSNKFELMASGRVTWHICHFTVKNMACGRWFSCHLIR